MIAKEEKKREGRGGDKMHPSKTRPGDLLPPTRPCLLCPIMLLNHEDISEHPEIRSEPLRQAVLPKGPPQNRATPRTEPLGVLHKKRTPTEPLDDDAFGDEEQLSKPFSVTQECYGKPL